MCVRSTFMKGTCFAPMNTFRMITFMPCNHYFMFIFKLFLLFVPSNLYDLVYVALNFSSSRQKYAWLHLPFLRCL